MIAVPQTDACGAEPFNQVVVDPWGSTATGLGQFRTIDRAEWAGRSFRTGS